MANVNYRKLAMDNLGFTIADLRDPVSRDAIIIEANKLQEEDSANARSSTFLRQSDIAKVLEVFPGFSQDPTMYGPTVSLITETLNAAREENDKVSRNRVAQHLAKMRAEGIIDSAPKLESNGKRGRPEVFYFLTDEPVFAKVISGEYTAKG